MTGKIIDVNKKLIKRSMRVSRNIVRAGTFHDSALAVMNRLKLSVNINQNLP